MGGGVVRSMEFQKAEAKRGLLWNLMDNISGLPNDLP